MPPEVIPIIASQAARTLGCGLKRHYGLTSLCGQMQQGPQELQDSCEGNVNLMRSAAMFAEARKISRKT